MYHKALVIDQGMFITFGGAWIRQGVEYRYKQVVMVQL